MNVWLRLFGAFVLDVSIRFLFNFGAWSPDILLITLIYYIMTRPVGEAYCMAFIFGLLWDAIRMDMTGMHAFLYILLVMMVSRLRNLIWGQYAISRLFLGFFFTAAVRFGEVLFWLSIMNTKLPVEVPKNYILSGAIASGLLFLLIPWNSAPIQFSRPNSHPILTGRWSYE